MSGNLCLNKTTVQNLKSKFRLIECSSCCGRVRTQFTTNLSEQDRAKTFLHFHDLKPSAGAVKAFTEPNQCEWMISKQCAAIFTSIWSSRTKYKIRRSRVSLNFCKRASEGSNDACLVGHFWQVIPLWWLPSPLLVNCLTQPTCFAYFDLCICHQPSLGLSEKFELLFHITNPN